jgi:hypothetical protein
MVNHCEVNTVAEILQALRLLVALPNRFPPRHPTIVQEAFRNCCCAEIVTLNSPFKNRAHDRSVPLGLFARRRRHRRLPERVPPRLALLARLSIFTADRYLISRYEAQQVHLKIVFCLFGMCRIGGKSLSGEGHQGLDEQRRQPSDPTKYH